MANDLLRSQLVTVLHRVIFEGAVIINTQELLRLAEKRNRTAGAWSDITGVYDEIAADLGVSSKLHGLDLVNGRILLASGKTSAGYPW